MIKDSRPAFVISLFLVGGLWTSPLLRITFEQMLYLSALNIFWSKPKIYSLVFPGKVLVADSEQADDNFSRQEVNRSGLSEDVHPFKYRELEVQVGPDF